MKRFIFTFILVLPFALTADTTAAQQPEAAEAVTDAAGTLPPSFPQPSGRADFMEIIAVVQAKYPEDFARIVKLHATDPQEAMRQGIELAKKAGVELPDFAAMPPMPPAETAQAIQFTFPRDNRKLNMQKADKAIQEAFPEEFAKLEELRNSSPEDARYLFKELAARIPGLIIKGQRQITESHVQEFPPSEAGAMPGYPGADFENQGRGHNFGGRSRRGNFPPPAGAMAPGGRWPHPGQAAGSAATPAAAEMP